MTTPTPTHTHINTTTHTHAQLTAHLARELHEKLSLSKDLITTHDMHGTPIHPEGIALQRQCYERSVDAKAQSLAREGVTSLSQVWPLSLGNWRRELKAVLERRVLCWWHEEGGGEWVYTGGEKEGLEERW